jgi:hypothetical protein
MSARSKWDRANIVTIEHEGSGRPFRRFYRTPHFGAKTHRSSSPRPIDATNLHHFQLEAALQIHPGGLGDG